jgi:hypothetical protein
VYARFFLFFFKQLAADDDVRDMSLSLAMQYVTPMAGK